MGELWGIGSATRTPAVPLEGGVSIATVLLLEDMGANYQVVVELNVEVMPGRDRCLSGSSGGQCCVTRNLAAESQFEVNSSYLYGVVDLPDGPNMIQTHVSVGRPGYFVTTDVYTQSGGTLRKSGNPTSQPLKMFQFIIGEFRFHLLRFLIAHLRINLHTPSLVFQTIALLIQLLPQLPLVPCLPLILYFHLLQLLALALLTLVTSRPSFLHWAHQTLMRPLHHPQLS